MAEGATFGTISAYRADRSLSQNKAAMQKLHKELQKLGYRPISTYANWKDEDTGEDYGERSYLVPNVRPEDVFRLGKEYGQDSVIYKSSKGSLGMYSTKGDPKIVFAQDDTGRPSFDVQAIKPPKAKSGPGPRSKERSEEELFSRSRGINFTFNFDFGTSVPWDGQHPTTPEGEPDTTDMNQPGAQRVPGGGRASLWDRYLDETWDEGHKKVRNLNTETRERYPYVTMDTLMGTSPRFREFVRRDFDKFKDEQKQSYAPDPIQGRQAKLTLKKYKKFCDAVAEQYDKLPAMQEDQKWRWDKLKEHIDKMYKQIQSRVKIEYVGGQPYDDAEEMVKKVKDTGTMQISKDFNNHPVFSEEENLQFRAVHDYIVHIMNADKGIDFSRKGEIKAYNLHRKLAPKEAWPALFSEVAAQACYANSRGEFPDQKVAILPMFDPVNVGNWADGRPVDPEEAKGTPGKGHRKDMGMEERQELWKRFMSEDVPNTNPDTRESHPQVQRRTLWQHGGGARNRVLQDWAQYVSRADPGVPVAR